MNRLTDQQLLRDYAGRRSEKAFAELARRHVDLVYSAALRMVRDAHLAEDVTQAVFIALSKDAKQLTDRPVLSGWLHRTTQNLAANVVRTEVRRRAREQEAATMNELFAHEPDAEWKNIAPHLDTALGELSEPDRDALLLRYFERKSAREMAQTLNVSEEAAQKRVNRAVERLREFFSKRNVTIGASGLVVLISANAVQAAPIGLIVTISSALSLAGTAVQTSTAIAATKTIAMTTLQKTLVTATVAILAGAGIYEARQASKLREENLAFQQQQAILAEQNEQLLREREDATKQLASLSTKSVPRLPAPQMRAVPAPAQPPVENLQASDLMLRLLKGETPRLTNEQIESYLKETGRNAASLLAISRATGDKSYLKEAMEKFPHDPRVAFDAVFRSESPEGRRQWLDNFKQSAPDNALADYLSALDHFRSGQTDQAVQDLIDASSKPQFQDYSWDFVQNAEEAWRAVGYSEAETRMMATHQLLLPHPSELKRLHQNITDLASAYRQAGDAASAEAALQYSIQLGQRLNGSPNDPLLNQIVGMIIQTDALGAMDPNSAYGTSGQTVAAQIEHLKQQDAAIKGLVRQLEPLQQTMSQRDWITYNDRTRAFGEVNALQWLIDKNASK